MYFSVCSIKKICSCIIFFFQHPFISKELDSKPIRDLLLEYKAEVVEEEVVDEDTDVSLFSIIILSSY